MSKRCEGYWPTGKVIDKGLGLATRDWPGPRTSRAAIRVHDKCLRNRVIHLDPHNAQPTVGGSIMTRKYRSALHEISNLRVLSGEHKGLNSELYY